ncbi:LOW QUALITY PROTEIN: stigma-specific STIG1-like protein 1 [Punica granatum]|uniref:LOW QUALITY PROTEIN: stigma-specific STIG1-like protein 1 n=1 Tax=Punica granatum TaxID=22663 RepID=A0A6P8DCI5_PUNGR|nr:LOW QUALITY PROTEIN: stigma-specific STIG1-like protein 1 [Punica granatum]
MNSLNQLFVLMLLTSLALLSHGSTTLYEADLSHEEDEFETDAEATFEATDDDSIPLRGIGRFLAQEVLGSALTTCDKYPEICRVKGSPGRNCCSKKCVDLKTDRLNCGKCGYKCKYSEICCKGKCVNPMSDKKHCGVCNNKCRHKKGKCVYGMCSYA